MRFSLASFVLGLGLLAAPWSLEPLEAEPISKVFIDGVPTPVYFMDGDSFKVLTGPLAGRNARLAGFNTLESYGPVHKWGGFHAKELYTNAKLATYNARKGIWHCFDKHEEDVYGRILLWCPDLAVDQVRRGLAHAMSATPDPAEPILLLAQADAIKHRRGMWAHGVPQYVLTSLHSINEPGSKGYAYNRLVSTVDGHSAKWKHKEAYGECQWVCRIERVVDESLVAEAARQAEADLADTVEAKGPALQRLVGDYARLGYFAGLDDEVQASALSTLLDEYIKEGRLGALEEREGACNLFVLFERRYGPSRAECLQ